MNVLRHTFNKIRLLSLFAVFYFDSVCLPSGRAGSALKISISNPLSGNSGKPEILLLRLCVCVCVCVCYTFLALCLHFYFNY